MEIKLNWTNPNAGVDGTRIYRSQSPMSPSNLPEPLVTVGAGVTEYVDRDVVRYQTYYYRFETFRGNEKALSAERMIEALPYTGPGPQGLKSGDMWEGYFGWVVPGRDFFSASELINALDFRAGTDITANEYIRWFKFAWRNQILYFPMGPLKHTLSWQQIYDAGLVYGVDGEGDDVIGEPVNQLRVVTRGHDSFIVRLPTVDDENLEESEWSALYARCLTWFSDWQAKGNWDEFSTQATRSCRAGSSGINTYTRDIVNGNALTVGTNNVSGVTAIDARASRVTNYAVSASAWRPMLVLKTD